ncbi:hypothetical protein C8J31_101177 [Rhizobium sp. PP-CC-2G-626]|nr:hypothetical protein C8J31_101177 [Rhizobium sp. PP-CC-2G-626]
MANTDYRDAVRILFILNGNASELNPDAGSAAEFPLRFVGEMRLQALDFWVRYPDYLADELLTQFNATGDVSKLKSARAIFEANEPSERMIPMLRKYYGAYEQLDTVMAILAMSRLVKPITVPNKLGKNTQRFLISPKVAELCDEIVTDHPIFNWYRERATLVIEVADGRGGVALKARQHEQKEYHESRIGDLIPTIAERVKQRLEEIAA